MLIEKVYALRVPNHFSCKNHSDKMAFHMIYPALEPSYYLCANCFEQWEKARIDENLRNNRKKMKLNQRAIDH